MADLTLLAAGHGFAAGDLNTDGIVAIQPAWQKVYFADGRPYSATKADSGYHKLDFINTRIVGEVTGTFTKGEIVTQADSDAKGVFDETVTVGDDTWTLIYRTTATEFVAEKEITGADSEATVTPVAAGNIVAPPHWLNWTLTSGTFPDGGSNIMALCFGRIFMNSMHNPNQWYATKINDPLNILLSQEGIDTAVASQTSEAGLVGDGITAIISYKGHYAIFGCMNQVWILRGDPAAGSQLSQIATPTGIFSNTAWTWDDKDNLYFMGMDGIYVLPATVIVSGGSAINVTKFRCPKLISKMGLNRRTDRVSMMFDKDRYGILVSVAQMDGVWGATFWLDLRTANWLEEGFKPGGIFPEQYQSDHVPASMMYFDARKKSERGLLLGGQDGYIRKFDETKKSDDGDKAIVSYDIIGPIVNSNNPRSTVTLSELAITTGIDTDGLEVSLYIAATAQKLIKNIINDESPSVSRIFATDKLLTSMRQKLTAGALAIKIGNSSADKSFSIEKIIVDMKGNR